MDSVQHLLAVLSIRVHLRNAARLMGMHGDDATTLPCSRTVGISLKLQRPRLRERLLR